MIYSYAGAIEKYKTDYKLKKAVNSKEIYKLADGIYSDTEYVSPLILCSVKYPNAIVTLDSAFYYYDLTDVIPQKVFLATDENSRVIRDNKIKQLFVSKRILFQGCEEVDVHGSMVKMYNKERLLVELIRRSNRIPFDYYKELISGYRKITDKLDMYKIEEYVALYKNEVRIFDAMQREVF